MTSLYNYSKENLIKYLQERNIPTFRATQIFEGLYRQKSESIEDIKGLKRETKEELKKDFVLEKLKIKTKQVSTDGTIKFLYELSDGSLIETVLMSHNYGYSVCVSSEVGCNMGCSFCASGLVKKIRNLETFEMVLQVLEIDNYLNKESKKVSHVVIMGIGEPFDNYDNVMEFIRIINDPKGLEIGARHITVSTCGIVPKIYEFSDFPLQVNLAISLHFADNEKRSKYMKINRKYPLEELMEAIKIYFEKTSRRVTFEYILLDGINDTIEDANNLINLLKGMTVYVNLIPYNETTGVFHRTPSEKVDAFHNYLEKNRINVITRKEQGHDIAAACGQLRIKEMNKKWEKVF